MIFQVYAIYDSAVEVWLPPIFSRSKGEMLRNFNDVVNNPESLMSKHPGDYALYEIGTFDDQKCTLDTKQPHRLGLALEFKKSSNSSGGKVVSIESAQEETK